MNNSKFIWSTECERAFQCSKELLVQNRLLVHYDSSKELFLTTDASEYGVGAVLSHKIDKEPVSFASGSLSDAQKGYAHVEKEALGIIFGVTKFHKFLYGRKFTLVTDHQPLKFIFDPLKRIPVTANARLQRWALLLSGYTYDIMYRKGTLLGNADALSRLPLPEITKVPDTINFITFTDKAPLDFKDIALHTRTDPILCKVYEYVSSGWPNSVSEDELKPYFLKRAELCIEQKCLLWGSRVIIPTKLRSKVLSMFHESHQGIVQCKMLMREYNWWPNLGLDIEKIIQGCDTCQATRNFTNTCPLVKWNKTEHNFERVHVDFFYVGSITYFLIVDARSKWLDVHIMRNTTASQVIEKLCKTFAITGISATLASDNGPPFNSSEFVNFLKANGCEAVKTPPYHPESNGMAERTVQSIKNSLSRLRKGKPTLSPEMLLQNFLFTYRNSPNATGMSPNEILFKQKPRTTFDLLKPHNVISQKICNGTGKKITLFREGEMVWCKDLSRGKGWIKGKVIQRLSEVRYIVRVEGVNKHYHASSLRSCKTEDKMEFETDLHNATELVQDTLGNKSISGQEIVPTSVDLNNSYIEISGYSENQNGESEMESEASKNDSGNDIPEVSNPRCSSPALRRSIRIRKAPERLNL